MTDDKARALAHEYAALLKSAQGTDGVDLLTMTFMRVYCEGILDARRVMYAELVKRAEALTLLVQEAPRHGPVAPLLH